MSDPRIIEGRMAAIRIENLDTDQIMPKQFLHGIDKSGLDKGVLYDLRFDTHGRMRPGFVLNRPEHAGTQVLVAGANFGCGSSREHAVWGLQQFGIRAVIAESFAEIFYSNAMNNRLLLVTLPASQIAALMDASEDAAQSAQSNVRIDVEHMTVEGVGVRASFSMLERHRRMFLEGLDVIGLSLTYKDQIDAYAKRHWAEEPWVKDVARVTRERLGAS